MRSWKLGRAFGINLYVHWTFLLLVAYVALQNWSMGGRSLAVLGVITLLAAFTCVLLHELGHALMARHFGIPTRDITLYPIGGVARLERMSEEPWEEFCIAVAGPAVNVVIAAILAVPAFSILGGLLPGQVTPQLFMSRPVLSLFFINLMLIGFNMIPAFPMDGGRVLRALLATPLGRVKATQIAATLGAIFAVLFVVGGIWLSPFLPVIGVFTFLIGRQELAAVRYQERVRKAPPLDALPVSGEILDALPVGGEILDVMPVNPDDHFSGSIWDEKRRICVIWRDGRPIYSYRLD